MVSKKLNNNIHRDIKESRSRGENERLWGLSVFVYFKKSWLVGCCCCCCCFLFFFHVATLSCKKRNCHSICVHLWAEADYVYRRVVERKTFRFFKFPSTKRKFKFNWKKIDDSQLTFILFCRQ